jgi:large subunit ribosomal protein L22
MEENKNRIQGKLIGADISPKKLKAVLKFLQGKNANKLRTTLLFSEGKAVNYVRKLLNSVVASAVHNFKLPAGDLVVKEAWSGPGPTRTTYAPRAKNMTTKIRHRTANVFLILGVVSKQEHVEEIIKKQTRKQKVNLKQEKKQKKDGK